MPPIPVTLDEDTQKLVQQIERHQHDITTFQIPRLRDCAGPLSLQQTLAAELRDDVDRLQAQIEELELVAGDVTGPVQRQVRELVAHHTDILAQMRREMRSALLASKRAIDASSRDARAQLFAGRRARQTDTTTGKSTSDEAVLDASQQVTDGLRRTMALMTTELERSGLSTQMLKSSTATLASTTTQHDVLTDLLGTSKSLVKALERSDWLDRLLIMSALAFFALVCAFILKQRIVDRSIRIAFFWTRFLPSFGADDYDLEVLEKGSRLVTTATASVVAAATSTVAAVVATVTSASQQPSSTESLATVAQSPSLVDEIAESMSRPSSDLPDELVSAASSDSTDEPVSSSKPTDDETVAPSAIGEIVAHSTKDEL
ncbi:Sec20-domain-containing protein [Auriculariales sp. MPI-PUGE-AT-0066]|nr:Sec20-domain-containing protein [Auriculariales sp. MPI-PUGE-AT-0066]